MIDHDQFNFHTLFRDPIVTSSVMMASSIFLLISAFFLFCSPSFALNVSHDGRAITIDGERRILLSGSIHYPRSTPEVSSNYPALKYCLLLLSLYA